MMKFKELKERGPIKEEGLQAFASELFHATTPSFEHELAILLFVVLPLFKELEKKAREGETEEIRSEYDALCGGYKGDGLMQMNIEVRRLANLLPEEIWEEYPHEDLGKLAKRIQDNLDGDAADLPSEFLMEWRGFMERHGWDGQDQLFPSCPRYEDSPVLLLLRLRQNVGPDTINPSEIQQEQVEKRRRVMALHEQREQNKKWYQRSSLSSIQSRNAILDHLMWIRNAPKLHWAQLCGTLRVVMLQVEKDLIHSGRLEAKDDIFHLNLDEVDSGLRDESFDMMELVRPRKMAYKRALRVRECPLLVDSRCRIIKPGRPSENEGDQEDGSLVGSAISPGVARGRVRILQSPSEQFEKGEVLVAIVTSPAWTPLFVGASAVIMQIGGVLQHGALCAREFGKPAVSNIDIHSALKTGMLVEVDGNSGVVKILEEESGSS